MMPQRTVASTRQPQLPVLVAPVLPPINGGIARPMTPVKPTEDEESLGSPGESLSRVRMTPPPTPAVDPLVPIRKERAAQAEVVTPVAKPSALDREPLLPTLEESKTAVRLSPMLAGGVAREDVTKRPAEMRDEQLDPASVTVAPRLKPLATQGYGLGLQPALGGGQEVASEPKADLDLLAMKAPPLPPLPEPKN